VSDGGFGASSSGARGEPSRISRTKSGNGVGTS
jgi:hypothetical protein